MIELLAVVRFIRNLVEGDDLLPFEVSTVTVQGEQEASCTDKTTLPRVISVGFIAGTDTSGLGGGRIASDTRFTVRVYGKAGEKYGDIKVAANRLDSLLQGASQMDTDPRFTVSRLSPLMGRDVDGATSYPFVGGIYRFLLQPDEQAGE